MKKILLLSSLILIASCSSIKPQKEARFNRNPSSYSTVPVAEVISEISNRSLTITQNSKDCAIDMRALYEKLFGIVGSSAYIDMDKIEILDRDIEQSFETRLKLKDSLRTFEIKSLDDKNCFSSIADIFKALRYIEDYMIVIRMQKTENAPTEYVNMTGTFPYLLVNPKYKDTVKSYEDLKSGDTILSRGGAYSSAAIARIGENDFQFSHLSFVYRDPNENNKMSTTEAHIEIGSVTAPFLEHLNEKNARSVVFRYNQDSDIAHRASEYIYKKVKTEMETGKNIEYDFAMNYKDDTRLFCSEIVSTGFHYVLPNEEYIPKFKSHFDHGLVPFLNNIGVPVTKETIVETEVFSPGDIQFDPRFDLVMEWRNPLKMQESRFKDFILTKMYEKMTKENYQIDPSFAMDAKAKTFWILRRFPIVKKFVEKKFPLNMNTTQLEIFMSLDKIGETIYKEIEIQSQAADHVLTPKEIYDIIDDYFSQDPKDILKYFHPPKVV